MADGTVVTPGTGTTIATREVTYSGETMKAQAVGLVTFAGADDAKTVADVPGGGGTEATALRVTLASDSTGVLSVDDNGASLTVDGTVAVSTNAEVGIVTEAAPATDTASSGLNGRLQRIAQRLTSIIALLPAALGQGTMAQSLKVAVASDQSTISTGSTAVVVSATPTLDTAAYASGDSLHTAVIEFANAVGARLSGWIDKMVIVDTALQSQPCELWLFSATVTPAAANAAHSISDADAAKCIGVISSGPYAASALNSVSVAKGVNLPIKCAASGLFGILVSRGTGTYAADSLTVSLQIADD